jgi:hypothetical protein
MESNSTSNVESNKNLDETQDADGKKSKANDSNVCYFDCKNCFNTFTFHRDQENVDPNMETDICKNCKAKQLFQGALLSEETSESIIPTKNIYGSHPAVSAAIEAVANFDATNLSPLTTKSYQQQGDTGGGSSSSSSSSNISCSGEPIHLPPSSFGIGVSHTTAVSLKPPKTISSNFSVMNLYKSHGVLDSEFESLVSENNEKRIEKFYAGVDVIYKPTDRKVFSCVPLLCPARVFHSSADDERELQCDVVVGILLDRHGSPFPLIAVYDAFNQFKNIVKGRYVVHTYFTRFQPSSIVHDFTAEQLKSISQELYPFLNIKSALQEMKGIVMNYFYY